MEKKNKPFKNYFGGKEGNGVYQTIINHIPPHSYYYEPFAGNATVFRFKRLSFHSVINDLNENTYVKLKWFVEKNYPAKTRYGNIYVTNENALTWLKRFSPFPDTVIYIDAPYPLSTRTSKTRYKHELTNQEHRQMLTDLVKLSGKGVKILISTYRNKLYDTILTGWNFTIYQSITRTGEKRKEILYYNFPKPAELHDYRYLGDNFYKRQKMRQKITRYVKKLSALPEVERNAIMFNLKQIKNVKPDTKAKPARPKNP